MDAGQLYLDLLLKRALLIAKYEAALESYSGTGSFYVKTDKHGCVSDVVSEAIILRETVEEKLSEIDRSLNYLEDYCFE